jgi:hypothetical protein
MRRALLIMLIMALFPPGAALGYSAYVQAEAFTDSYDVALYPITSSLGLLNGLDFPSEWTQYSLPIMPFGTYRVYMRCWGDPQPYELHLLTFPGAEQEPQTIVLSFTGLGLECT